MFECFAVASEEKILSGRRPQLAEAGNIGAKDEVLSFQAAYFSDVRINDLDVRTDGIAPECIEIRAVEPVPCTFPSAEVRDDWYLSHEPFLCPDLLRPIDKRKPCAMPGRWQSVWFTVRNAEPGRHDITVSFFRPDGERLGQCTYRLDIVDFALGKSPLVYTNWFHYDGIADYYRLEMFSDDYNRIMRQFISCAVRHGMNMLLTPMFTPPLDTRVGGERKTAQLVDVTRTDGAYTFSFDRLIGFMRDVQSLGIEYFEMSHLSTQWGAAAAPKVMATENGEYRRLFGWDTPAAGGEYERFLRAFLPALKEALCGAGLYEKCFFHISDEPSENNLASYNAARAIFTSVLPDAPVMDALSHYEFYERGLVDRAIAATSAIQPFLDRKTPDLWAYYCCGQGGDYLSNRFMAMPGERTRVLGFQLFMNDIRGFLQWGYNFYNSSLSDIPVDPFGVTDACGAFQSGDAFIVYPGPDGPLDSVRHEHTFDAIQDLTLMTRYAERFGRAEGEKCLTDAGFEKNFTVYPRDARTLKAIRRRAMERLAD